MRNFIGVFLLIFSSSAFAATTFLPHQIVNPACFALFDRSEVSPFLIRAIDLNRCQKTSRLQSIPVNQHWYLINYPKHGEGFYQYRLLGKTKNNIYVVETVNNTGGTAQIMNLLFFRLVNKIDDQYNWSQQKFEKRHFKQLSLIAEMSGGDRATGGFVKLKLTRDQLFIERYSLLNLPNSPSHQNIKTIINLAILK